MYREIGSEQKLADKLGWSRDAVKNTLHRYGVYGKTGRPRGCSIYLKRNYFRKWLVTHPGEALPANPKAIVDITGVKLSQVRSYFLGRKLRYIRNIEKLGSLLDREIVLKTPKEYIPMRAVKSYKWKVHWITLNVTLNLDMKAEGLSFKLVVPPHQFREFFSSRGTITIQEAHTRSLFLGQNVSAQT